MYTQFIKNGLVLGAIVLLISSSFASGFQIHQSAQSSSRGNWLYVGGSGPGNYTSIQHAINNASDGDTVYVYNGTYNEGVYVLSAINIIGEDKNTTFIIAENDFPAFDIWSDHVNISGFTLKTTQHDGSTIIFYSNNCSVHDNILHDIIWCGMYLFKDANYNHIYQNLIVNSTNNSRSPPYGIRIDDCNHNTIYDNIIKDIEGNAISFSGDIGIKGDYNNIYNNIIENAYFGIESGSGVSYNNIYGNIITNIKREGIRIAGYGEVSRNHDNIICNNTVMNCTASGLLTWNNYNESIIGNIFSNCTRGISIHNYGQNINISWNTVINNSYCGIEIVRCGNITIYENIIENNTIGIIIQNETTTPSDKKLHKMLRLFYYPFNAINYKSNSDNKNQFNIINNNFKNNKLHSIFRHLILTVLRVYWDGNYWGRARLRPKPILGFKTIQIGENCIPILPRLQFDMHPAQHPYETPRIAI